MAKQWHQLERLDHKALKKLQNEREKAAKIAAQKEQKQKIILGLVFAIIVMSVFCVLIVVVKNKNAKNALLEAQEKLLYSTVTEFTGTVDYRTSSEWMSLDKNIKFKEDHTFRTQEESSVTVLFQLDNQIKLYSSSEAKVNPPVIEANEAQIKKQVVEMARGEMTTAISISGKGILNIQVSNLSIIGQSGLFKIIYDDEKDKGEVVVKNGLVEVGVLGSEEKPTKLSGFYKVTFEGGELDKPTQASVIQYDWR